MVNLLEKADVKPVITIGICARNSEKLVKYAVESVLRQDFPHQLMQIVFVDDGSEDSTLQVFRECASKTSIHVKIFRTQWKGLGPARNLVVKNADGDYILWVDADEILSQAYVREQVEFMQENPKVGITTGINRTVPKNLVLNLELIPTIVTFLNFGQPPSIIWKTRKLPGTGGATFRLKALKQINGFDEQLTGVGEDQEAAQRIVRAGWLVRINSSVLYELHGGLRTFDDLWRKYVWYGFGNERIYRQNRELFSLPRMSPVAGFWTGVFFSIDAYKHLHETKVFLLPIHYGIKMTAWMFGFMKGQISRKK